MSPGEKCLRAQEDELFVFVAAFKQVPPNVDSWNQLFVQLCSDLFPNIKTHHNLLTRTLRFRLSYSLFVAELVKALSKFREEHNVAFALENVSSSEIIHAPCAKLPAIFERVSSECIDAYFANYVVVAGEGFLRRRFSALRGAWLRETFFRFLPILALVVTAVISALAISAMRRSSVDTNSGPGSTGVFGGINVTTGNTQSRTLWIA